MHKVLNKLFLLIYSYGFQINILIKNFYSIDQKLRTIHITSLTPKYSFPIFFESSLYIIYFPVKYL